MSLLATCPGCRQQIEFFGIAHYRVKGRRDTVHARWSECTSCGMMIADNFEGRILHTRKPFTKDEINNLFPTTREKGERNKTKREAKDV